eukprot:647504-Heterocapsa_arctica.AAC.1
MDGVQREPAQPGARRLRQHHRDLWGGSRMTQRLVRPWNTVVRNIDQNIGANMPDSKYFE